MKKQHLQTTEQVRTVENLKRAIRHCRAHGVGLVADIESATGIYVVVSDRFEDIREECADYINLPEVPR